MNRILSIDGCLLNIQMKRGMQRIVGGLIQIPRLYMHLFQLIHVTMEFMGCYQ
jgi:hypothetical protein